MVFKTIESDLTNSGKTLSILNRDMALFVKNWNNTQGLKNRFQSAFTNPNVITQSDLTAIEKYNNAIASGVSKQTAFYRHLNDSSIAVQNLASNAKYGTINTENLTVATDKLTIATKLANGAMRLLANVGLALAINAIITLISKVVNYQKELNEKIKEFGNIAKDTSKNVSSLYAEYLKLNEAVANGTGNKEDLKSATDNLLDSLGLEGIAVDELIQKYETLEEAMTQISIEKLKEAHNNLVSSKDVYKDELLKAGGSTFWGDNTFKFLSTDNDLLFKNSIRQLPPQLATEKKPW